MANTYVKRTTLFKIPQEHIDKVLKEYETLRKNAVKVRTNTHQQLTEMDVLMKRKGRQALHRLQCGTPSDEHGIAAQRGLHNLFAICLQEPARP